MHTQEDSIVANRSKRGEPPAPPDENDPRNPFLVEVGLKLLNARRRAGLHQHELANKAGLSHSTVFLTENGRQHITITSMKALADALGTPLRDLIPGEDAPRTVAPEALQQVTDTLVGALGRATMLMQQAESTAKTLAAISAPEPAAPMRTRKKR